MKRLATHSPELSLLLRLFSKGYLVKNNKVDLNQITGKLPVVSNYPLINLEICLLISSVITKFIKYEVKSEIFLFIVELIKSVTLDIDSIINVVDEFLNMHNNSTINSSNSTNIDLFIIKLLSGHELLDGVRGSDNNISITDIDIGDKGNKSANRVKGNKSANRVKGDKSGKRVKGDKSGNRVKGDKSGGRVKGGLLGSGSGINRGGNGQRVNRERSGVKSGDSSGGRLSGGSSGERLNYVRLASNSAGLSGLYAENNVSNKGLNAFCKGSSGSGKGNATKKILNSSGKNLNAFNKGLNTAGKALNEPFGSSGVFGISGGSAGEAFAKSLDNGFGKLSGNSFSEIPVKAAGKSLSKESSRVYGKTSIKPSNDDPNLVSAKASGMSFNDNSGNVFTTKSVQSTKNINDSYSASTNFTSNNINSNLTGSKLNGINLLGSKFASSNIRDNGDVNTSFESVSAAGSELADFKLGGVNAENNVLNDLSAEKVLGGPKAKESDENILGDISMNLSLILNEVSGDFDSKVEPINSPSSPEAQTIKIGSIPKSDFLKSLDTVNRSFHDDSNTLSDLEYGNVDEAEDDYFSDTVSDKFINDVSPQSIKSGFDINGDSVNLRVGYDNDSSDGDFSDSSYESDDDTKSPILINIDSSPSDFDALESKSSSLPVDSSKSSLLIHCLLADVVLKIIDLLSSPNFILGLINKIFEERKEKSESSVKNIKLRPKDILESPIFGLVNKITGFSDRLPYLSTILVFLSTTVKRNYFLNGYVNFLSTISLSEKDLSNIISNVRNDIFNGDKKEEKKDIKVEEVAKNIFQAQQRYLKKAYLPAKFFYYEGETDSEFLDSIIKSLSMFKNEEKNKELVTNLIMTLVK